MSEPDRCVICSTELKPWPEKPMLCKECCEKVSSKMEDNGAKSSCCDYMSVTVNDTSVCLKCGSRCMYSFLMKGVNNV